MTTATIPPADAPAAVLLDVRAVARLLDCSPRHVYRLADGGLMPLAVRVGALVRWRRTTGDPTTGIEDWIAAGCPAVRQGGRPMSKYVTGDELAQYGITPQDVRARCPWAVEYTVLDGGPCWVREDLAELLDGEGGDA